MATFLVQKLIRDHLDTEGRFNGLRVLDEDEYIQALKQKLIEEATEARDADTREDLIDELADLHDILHYLQATTKISLDEITAARDKKYKKRGGFEKRQYAESVTFTEDHRLTKHCRNQPDKYTEIQE